MNSKFEFLKTLYHLGIIDIEVYITRAMLYEIVPKLKDYHFVGTEYGVETKIFVRYR